MVSELLRKYIWLVQTFVKAGDRGLELGEILDKWERVWGTSYSRRSFNNHREAVFEVFGIRIECNKSNYRYFIPYSEDVRDEDSETAWLINTFTLNNLLSLSKERLSGRVAVEDVPSGRKYLSVLMEAMSDNSELLVSYLKYTSTESDDFHVLPYSVKEYEKRWYLIGFCKERDAMRVYALDRIVNISVLPSHFDMPEDFDVNVLFSNSYGIYLPGEEGPEEIRFRAVGKEINYLRDLPLHKSQVELESGTLEDGRNYVVFGINVIPNDNLIMDFCKYCSRIEVLEPQYVRDRIIRELNGSLYR